MEFKKGIQIGRSSLVSGLYLALLGFCLIGCGHLSSQNAGNVQSYPAPSIEASWIREGKPIQYDGKQWYPVNDIEVLTDAEVYQIGEYQEVLFFVDKVDTKPYKRIYTKFSKNKYRYFEQRSND
jgi:hypothetical protein